jgi:hypothetical protein
MWWCWWPLIFLAFGFCGDNRRGFRHDECCPRGRELPERFSFPPMRRFDLNPFESDEERRRRERED